ncbi:MAG: hypothetical protein ABL879_17460 [Devosia sp.]
MKLPRGLTVEQHAGIEEARAGMVARANRGGWRKWVLYGLQAALFHPFLLLFKLLPVDAASTFGGWVGRSILAPLLYFNRGKMRRTMRVPFPAMTDRECDRLVSRMSDNLIRTMSELAHLREFAGNDNARTRIIDTAGVEGLRASGRPILLLGCHIGNFELSEVAARTVGVDGIVAVQHPHNPFLVRWFARSRFAAGFGEQIGTGAGVYRALRRGLTQGRNALMLCDQRVGNGLKAPFFGLDTMTNVIPARLARTLPMAVVPFSVRRRLGATFEVTFHPELVFERTGDAEDDERRFLARINGFFETQMLQAPEQWLWLHPRWDDVLLKRVPQREGAPSATKVP